MRLGANICKIKKDSLAHKAYNKLTVSERHRHRYEFNNDYKMQMEAAGFLITGSHEKRELCEIAEIKDHPWMVGVQFHPEFQSKPTAPHPLFHDFIQAIAKAKK